ncbi:MAG TPA: DUF2905 domain-containing protein [Myxococcota bacterium]|nr:DUF2905 domain-containing protein [Myxococcota bacterium]
MGRALVVLGIVLVLLGLLLQVAPQIPWLGRLPGDIRVERPGLRFYAPLATSLLLSLVVTLVLALLARLR